MNYNNPKMFSEEIKNLYKSGLLKKEICASKASGLAFLQYIYDNSNIFLERKYSCALSVRNN